MIIVSKQVSKPYFWLKEFYNDWEDIIWITKVYRISYIERILNTKEEKWSKIIKTTTTVVTLTLKIFFNARGEYLYSRAKPKRITLNIMQ